MARSGTERLAVVTGGLGAIGSLLVRRLLRDGARVVVLDNLASGRLENLGEDQGHASLRIVRMDLLRPARRLRSAIRGATELWHLAANPDIRRGTADPKLDFDQGARVTSHVLEAARAEDVPWIGYSSSSVVYGWPTVFPTPESYGPLLPHSQYGANKLACEGLLSAYCHSYGMGAAIFRFANVVGPGMTHGITFDFLMKLSRDPSRLEVLGDGRQAKSYLWTPDCVDGLCVGRDRGERPVGIYNLGSSDQLTAMEIARKVAESLGGKARIETTGGERGWVGDVPKQWLSTDKIRALGWAPTCTSATAIDRTIPLLRAQLGI